LKATFEEKQNLLRGGLLALLILLLPLFFQNKYYISLFVVVGIHSLVVLGLTLFMGFAGQVSLGHAAFYGIGAYITGVLSTKFGFPVMASFLLAIGGTGFIALVIAYPILKIKGFYLGMATLGFAEIVYIFLNQTGGLTGGGTGLGNIPRISISGVVFDSDMKYYYFVWLLFFVLFIFSMNFLSSRIGRALRAIHEDEMAAETMGINVARYKTMVFVLSAIYAGLAGALYAHYVSFLSPGICSLMFNVIIIAMVVIGGSGSIWGALLGTVLLTLVPEYLVYFQDYEPLVYGLMIIGIVMFSPQGLVGLLDRLWTSVSAAFSHRGCRIAKRPDGKEMLDSFGRKDGL
jgi:branched-chain amino acid transport system permease protein